MVVDGIVSNGKNLAILAKGEGRERGGITDCRDDEGTGPGQEELGESQANAWIKRLELENM